MRSPNGWHMVGALVGSIPRAGDEKSFIALDYNLKRPAVLARYQAWKVVVGQTEEHCRRIGVRLGPGWCPERNKLCSRKIRWSLPADGFFRLCPPIIGNRGMGARY